MKTKYTDVSADLSGRSTTQIVRAEKGDTGRSLRVRIRDGGEPYEIAPDCYAVLMGKKPDGTVLYNSCQIADNTIFYPFTEQTCTSVGSFQVQIRLYGSEKKHITTVPIQLEVYPTAFDAEEAAKSQDEQRALDDLVNRTRELQLDILHGKQTGAFDGESAYEIAKRLGFTGSEAEWLESLRYDHSEEFKKLSDQVREDVRSAAGCAERAAGAASGAAAHANAAGKQAQAAAGSAAQAQQSNQAADGYAEAAKTASIAAQKAAADAAAQADTAKSEAQKAVKAAEAAKNIIDDTSISHQKTYSSQKITEDIERARKETIDSCAPPFEKTGAVVQGHLVPGYPMEVISHIIPWQEGKGDPTPENVRPIHGWSKLAMGKCGKNLIPRPYLFEEQTPVVDGLTVEILPDGGIKISGVNNSGSQRFLNLCAFDFGKSMTGAYPTNGVFTISGNRCEYNGVNKMTYIPIKSGERLNETIYPQIEVGTTPTPYTPYSGETFLQTLPEEVFGGLYNWRSGELTSEMAVVHGADILRGSTGENTEPTAENWFSVYGDVYTDFSIVQCNKLQVRKWWGLHSTPTLEAPVMWNFSASSGIAMPYAVVPSITKESSAAEKIRAVKAYFGEYDILVRSTPKTIKLPPTPGMLSQDGVTTVYGNSGDTAVIARADPNHISKTQDSRIAALEEKITQMMEVR